MAPRSWAGTLVGYAAKNQWRISDGKEVFVRRDVVFNESSITYKKPRDIESPNQLPDDMLQPLIDEPVGEKIITESVGERLDKPVEEDLAIHTTYRPPYVEPYPEEAETSLERALDAPEQPKDQSSPQIS